MHVSWFVNSPLLFHACQLICELPHTVSYMSADLWTSPYCFMHVSWFVNTPLLFHACQLICKQPLIISCMSVDLWTAPYYFMHDSWFVNHPLLFHACQLICVHPLTISCMSANLWTPQNTPFMHTIWASALLLPDASQNLDTRFYLGTFGHPRHLPLVCPFPNQVRFKVQEIKVTKFTKRFQLKRIIIKTFNWTTTLNDNDI